MTRDVCEKLLSIGSYMGSRDCRFTTFSIVRSGKGQPKQRTSCVHRRNYKLSMFEVTHHQGKCAKIGLYVALHKERFHIVLSGSDAMAIATIKSQIAAEEYTRQRLQWINERQSALDAMTVHERSTCEAQYDEISRALREWRESAHQFSSFKWNGQESSPALNATHPMDPCLLCEAGVAHMVPIIYFDINAELPNQTRAFADSPIGMEVEIAPCELYAEAETSAERMGVLSSRALFKRWVSTSRRGRAEALVPMNFPLQKKMITCTTEFRARIRSLGKRLNKCDSINDAVS